MEPAVLLHDAVHRPPADFDPGLLKRQTDAVHAVAAVVRMLRNDLFDLDRKKLASAALVPVSQPTVVAGLT